MSRSRMKLRRTLVHLPPAMQNLLSRGALSGGTTPASSHAMVSARPGPGRATSMGLFMDDVESPRTLNPSSFAWGSPDHYRECYSRGSASYPMGGYAVHLPPAVGADLWMACEVLLPSPANPLNAAILEDLLAMEEGERSAMLGRALGEARSVFGSQTTAIQGPMRVDYLDAFTNAIDTMPQGSFPATEKCIVEMERQSAREWGEDYQEGNGTSTPPLTGKMLGEEVRERMEEHLAGYYITSHYQPMAASQGEKEVDAFLMDRRRGVVEMYLNNLLTTTRQLSNLADIARLPFNRDKGTWSSYLNNRIDQGEWAKMGYSSVEKISPMAGRLHDFIEQLLQAGKSDPSILLSLYEAQNHLSLSTLLALSKLAKEYNVEWALASMEWEAVAQEVVVSGESGTPPRRSTPGENALEMKQFHWVQW